MPATDEHLKPFHDKIVKWRSERTSLKDIAAALAAEGVSVHRNAVDRYCQNHQIPRGEKPQHIAKSETTNPVSDKQGNLDFVKQTEQMVHMESASPSQAIVKDQTVRRRPTVKPKPLLPESFVEIDTQRALVLRFLRPGCTALEIMAVLRECGIDVTLERVIAYIESLLHQLCPVGTIIKELLVIHDPGREWRDDLLLLHFNNAADKWTVGDFCQGALITGASGSSKTTGSGRFIATTFLASGMGGLVFAIKPGDAEEWVTLAQLCGRGGDICCVKPDGFLRLNALAYEAEQEQGAHVDNLVHFLKNLATVLGQHKGQSMSEGFWRDTGDQLLRKLIELFFLARRSLTIDGFSKAVIHAPEDAETAANWRQIPYLGELLAEAEENATTEDTQHTFEGIVDFFLYQFRRLAPNTRSCVITAFSAMVDALRSSKIHNLLSTHTTITPEMIFGGKIVVIDLPVNVHHEAGLLVQTAWKYVFERAALRRYDKQWGLRCRPCFIWEDEGHNTLIEYDAEFHPVARDRRIARVLLTQNINNLFNRFGGGDGARVKVESILAGLNTRIAHCNGDMATNKWMSESIGTYEKHFTEQSTTPAQYHGINPFMQTMYQMFKPPSVTVSTHTVREPYFHAHDFATLSPGGADHGFITEAIITQVGRRFADGKPYGRVQFKQTLLPVRNHTQDEIKASLQAIRKETLGS